MSFPRAPPFAERPLRRVIYWRCPACGLRTPEELPVSRRQLVPLPTEETIPLTCFSCEQKRRDRILAINRRS